jgi:DNA-binding LytR/AlgR family response regulator
MHAVILEDELIASKRLTRLIKEVNVDIVVDEIFTSIRDIASYLMEIDKQPDILFLDIHVLDGISLELFNIIDIKSKVIFTTAYDEYAIKAFRHNATDYLLKPIKKDELAEAIARAQPQNSKTLPKIETDGYKDRLLVKFSSKLYSIKTSEIAYIMSQNKIAYIYNFDGSRTASDYKLQDLEKLLNPEKFFRVNRQFLVNFEAITNLKVHNASRLKMYLKPMLDQEVIISTEKTKIFKKWIDR